MDADCAALRVNIGEPETISSVTNVQLLQVNDWGDEAEHVGTKFKPLCMYVQYLGLILLIHKGT